MFLVLYESLTPPARVLPKALKMTTLAGLGQYYNASVCLVLRVPVGENLQQPVGGEDGGVYGLWFFYEQTVLKGCRN
jgi:hypothetical protein